jgi:hypothetical protein
VNIIKIKKINKINFISSSTYVLEAIDCSAVSLIKVTINTVKDENIEDRDEYLNIRETVSHVNINRRPN